MMNVTFVTGDADLDKKFASEAAKNSELKTNEEQVNQEASRIESIIKKGTIKPLEFKNNIKNLMWEKVAIVRDEKTLNEALSQLQEMQKDLENLFALYDDGDKSISQTLAATVNAGAEYTMPFYRNMSIGVLYTGRFYGDYSWHQGMVSANLRPLKWLEVNANAAATSTGFTMGAMLSLNSKIAKFYIGSDRLIGSSPAEIMTAKEANSNISLGLTIPL